MPASLVLILKETLNNGIIQPWKCVLSAERRLISAYAVPSEAMSASWIWGSYIVLSASLNQRK